MIKPAITAGLAVVLAGSGLTAQAADNAPKEKDEKISYAIGADIGEKLKETDGSLKADFVAQGVRDAFAGKLALDEKAIHESLQTFQTELMAKMEAKEKEQGDKNAKASEAFLAENKKKEGVKTLPSGLQYKIVKEGTGAKPGPEDEVTVHYTGKLVDGTEFDSSVKRGEPVTFPVGRVIPGWTEALQLMPVGSKWELFIPPALAYGESAPPMIGPNQALIFDVELLDIKKGEAKEDAKAEEKAEEKAEKAPKAK